MTIALARAKAGSLSVESLYRLLAAQAYATTGALKPDQIIENVPTACVSSQKHVDALIASRVNAEKRNPAHR